MDSQIPSTSSTSTATSTGPPLTFPTFDSTGFAASTPASATSTRQLLLKDRLYVGNLHPSVDEHTLITAFAKCGPISKLDFLFHKAGPLRGKPRGYAFVEYADPAAAAAAVTRWNSKTLRGRALVVTYAQQAPSDSTSAAYASSSPYTFGVSGLSLGGDGGDRKRRHPHVDAGKPTALSLLKAGPSRHDGTDSKIARMEAKLAQLAASTAMDANANSDSAGDTNIRTSSTMNTSSLPTHPSLPAKPAAAAIMARQEPDTDGPAAKRARTGTDEASRIGTSMRSGDGAGTNTSNGKSSSGRGGSGGTGPTLALARRAVAATAKAKERAEARGQSHAATPTAMSVSRPGLTPRQGSVSGSASRSLSAMAAGGAGSTTTAAPVSTSGMGQKKTGISGIKLKAVKKKEDPSSSLLASTVPNPTPSPQTVEALDPTGMASAPTSTPAAPPMTVFTTAPMSAQTSALASPRPQAATPLLLGFDSDSDNGSDPNDESESRVEGPCS